MFQLSSCSTLIKFDNWKKYTKWESDDGSVILCSYDMTNAGFGQIIDNNNTLDIYWVAASPNGSSLRLMINEKSESNTFDIIMSFEYSKIVLPGAIPAAPCGRRSSV